LEQAIVTIGGKVSSSDYLMSFIAFFTYILYVFKFLFNNKNYYFVQFDEG